ncbi:MAG: prephenate dehydrogenase/arogenate dehydrogenase family protein [Deltaproteobacteria bacterium]|nr:prephenate dehydrogenase/arogenate dehydrogenase family protein [Deltaproteobacteria bacterium]
MKAVFKNVAILGLGLIGGSIALELKKRRLAQRVVGYNRSAPSRRAALRLGACDAVFEDSRQAVKDADLVILATPVRSIPELATQIAPYLKVGALVTDVGSTKAALVKAAAKALPKHAVFIGGHPIAGTENTGMASAELDLFQNRWWVLTPPQGKKSQALSRLTRWVKDLGAKPVSMSPEAHDRILGAVSHLPHVLAYALIHAVAKDSGGKALKFAGRSFRDVTRIAASSPDMWVDIALDNRGPLLDWLKKYEKVLVGIRRGIAAGDAKKLRTFFAEGAGLRRKL